MHLCPQCCVIEGCCQLTDPSAVFLYITAILICDFLHIAVLCREWRKCIMHGPGLPRHDQHIRRMSYTSLQILLFPGSACNTCRKGSDLIRDLGKKLLGASRFLDLGRSSNRQIFTVPVFHGSHNGLCGFIYIDFDSALTVCYLKAAADTFQLCLHRFDGQLLRLCIHEILYGRFVHSQFQIKGMAAYA